MALTTIRDLRQHAIANSLFHPATLKGAVEKLGFVQSDPIRAPARAQDLILRHRVVDYRAGDLERFYPELEIEEDYLYAYGFVSKATWRLLHPRLKKRLTQAEQRVFDLAAQLGRLHPRALAVHLGHRRQVNAWGGYSKATTRTLETLHYCGLLRVAVRDKGIRVYEAARVQAEIVPPTERLQNLVLLIAGILAPIPERSLQKALQHLAHSAPALTGRRSVVSNLLKAGKLATAEVADVRYVWPAADEPVRFEAKPEVRFLAPFDPLVWDRYRFEHFWGWPYRFEAYTPVAKRRLGYYAMPLLWRDQVIGWVNVAKGKEGIEVDAGFIGKKPVERSFKSAFEAETARIEQFLLPRL